MNQTRWSVRRRRHIIRKRLFCLFAWRRENIESIAYCNELRVDWLFCNAELIVIYCEVIFCWIVSLKVWTSSLIDSIVAFCVVRSSYISSTTSSDTSLVCDPIYSLKSSSISAIWRYVLLFIFLLRINPLWR